VSVVDTGSEGTVAPAPHLSVGQVVAAVVIVPGLVLVGTAALVVIGRLLGVLFDGSSPTVLVVAVAWVTFGVLGVLGVRAAVPWYERRFGPFVDGLVGSTAGWRIHAQGLAAGVATALVVMWPFTSSPGAERWVGAYDAPYNAWLGWRISEAVRSGTIVPTHIPDALWPVGIDLLVTDGWLPTYVTGLLNVVGFGPYAAYNLTLVLGVALNVWAAARLAAVFTDRRWLSIGLGVAYAVAPAVAAPVQAHAALAWSFAVPLLVRAAVRQARGDAPVRPLALGGLLVLAFACSTYHLVLGGLAYVLVVVLWPGSAVRARAAALRVGAALVVALVVLSPFLVARFSFEADEVSAGATDRVRVTDAFLLSSDALAAVVPPEELAVSLPGPRPSLGPEAFASLRIGFVGVVLLGVGGFAWVLRRRGVGALTASAGVVWLLGLGPGLHVAGRYVADGGSVVSSLAWLPFRVVVALPGLGNLRAPYRVSYALCALLVALAALGLEEAVARSRPRGRVVVGGAVAVGIVLSILGPLPTSDLGITTPVAAALTEIDLRGRPGESVLVVPFGCRLDDPRIVALQIEHGQPSIGCSTSRAATPFASGLDAWGDSAGLHTLWCDDASVGQVFPAQPPDALDADSLADLRSELGVRFVLLDRGSSVPASCPWLAESVELLLADAEVLADDGSWVVLDLAPATGDAGDAGLGTATVPAPRVGAGG